MGRGAILALAITMICGAIPGSAAAWQELPPQGIGHAGVATCLRSPAEGLLTVTGFVRREGTPMTLLSAGPSGFIGAKSISLGALDTCPAVASNSSGDGLLVGFARDPSPSSSFNGAIRAAAISRSGKPSGALDVARTRPYVEEIAVAVDEQGQATIAWLEEGTDNRTRMRAAMRKPDGNWTSPFEVIPPLRGGMSVASLSMAPDQSGGFLLAWTQSIATNGRTGPKSEVRLATIRGGAVASVVGIGRGVVSTVQVHSTADGRILLVQGANGKLILHERTPGSAGFEERTLSEAGQRFYDPVLALRPDGAALLAAWFAEPHGGRDLGLAAWMRAAPGDFGHARTVLPARHIRIGGAFFFRRDAIGGRLPSPPEDLTGDSLHALLASDGAAMLTLGWGGRVEGGDSPDSLLAITGTLATGLSRPRRLGSPCRPVDGATPLLIKDGPAAAWVDNLTRVGGEIEQPFGHGLVHVALPTGMARATPPAPRARLTVHRQALKYAQSLKARASCDRACELRAFVIDRQGEEIAVGSASLTRRGSKAMTIATLSDEYHISGGRSGPVEVKLHACAPGSTSMSTAHATAHIDLIPPAPFPVLSGIEAHREKHAIVITWTEDRPAKSEDVFPEFHGRGVASRFSASTDVTPDGRHVTMRISIAHPERISSLTLLQSETEPPSRIRTYFVRVK